MTPTPPFLPSRADAGAASVVILAVSVVTVAASVAVLAASATPTARSYRRVPTVPVVPTSR